VSGVTWSESKVAPRRKQENGDRKASCKVSTNHNWRLSRIQALHTEKDPTYIIGIQVLGFKHALLNISKVSRDCK
jgi:hypothetical protein